mgnify:CR=1 FL=1
MDGEHGGVLPLHPLLSLLTHLTHAQKSHTPHSLTLQTHTQIETVLDEATAEAAKLAVSHLVSTIDVRFKMGRWRRVFPLRPPPGGRGIGRGGGRTGAAAVVVVAGRAGRPGEEGWGGHGSEREQTAE